MISLIAESLHFLHLLSNKEIQCSLKLLPIPETCLEGQTCVRVFLVQEHVLRGQPKSIQFQFCFCTLWIHISCRRSLEVPEDSEITACYWHETSFPLSHITSIEQKRDFFTGPKAKLLFNFNVYQNSNSGNRHIAPGQTVWGKAGTRPWRRSFRGIGIWGI